MIKILSCLIPIKFIRIWFRQFCNSIQIIFTAKSIGKNFQCSRFSTVNKNTVIKDHVKLNGMRISGNGDVVLGNYFVAGFDSQIISSNHNYEGNDIPYDGTSIKKGVTIGDFVWIGAKVIILPGTVIGEGAIIQAGAVVHGEIPPYAIAGGNPAKVFKYRNIEHFIELKNRKKNIWSVKYKKNLYY